MKAAIVQLKSGSDKGKNIKKALCLVQCAVARGAEFILLPEMFNFRGKADPRKGFKDIAENIPGPSTAPLMEAARKNRIAILAGSICEKSAGQRKVYNTSALIDARGDIIAKYRKSHLFDAKIGAANIKESQYFAAGQKHAMASLGPWKIGLSICFDLRFPEFYRKYREGNADILCVPSAFAKITGRAHWEVLLRARAVENMCYVLAPNQIGMDGKGVTAYGNSMVVDPWGEILARASADQEEILFAELDKGLIKEKRSVLGFRN
ncbi:MAG: carbon-nitrogen hydrolase family protein [Candidatus Omnitrophica bacterium]|nr:carbon-nitrogen hydrolase family protein [Candidatus Omnitrophota bacterium]